MINDNYFYCLKVEYRRYKQTDYYFRYDYNEILALAGLITTHYPHRVFSIFKVKSLPLLEPVFLNEEERAKL